MNDEEMTYPTSDGRYHTVMPRDSTVISSTHHSYIMNLDPAAESRLIATAAHLDHSMRTEGELEGDNTTNYMVHDHPEDRVYKYILDNSNHISMSSYSAVPQYHHTQQHQERISEDQHHSNQHHQDHGYNQDTESHLYSVVRQTSMRSADTQHRGAHFDLIDSPGYYPRDTELKSIGEVMSNHTNSSPSSPLKTELLFSGATTDVLC